MHSRSCLCGAFVLVRMETQLRGCSDEYAGAVPTRSPASSRKGAPVVALCGMGYASYGVGSSIPAACKASLRSMQVPHLPQWCAPPL